MHTSADRHYESPHDEIGDAGAFARALFFPQAPGLGGSSDVLLPSVPARMLLGCMRLRYMKALCIGDMIHSVWGSN